MCKIPTAGKSLFCALSWLAAAPLAAEELKVGVLDFPPYYVAAENQPPSGILVDLLRNVLDEAKLDYSLAAFPAKRLYLNLAKGETEIFIGIKGVPAYDGAVLYGYRAITDIALCIYTPEEVSPVTSKEQLIGKTVLVINGYSYSDLRPFLDDPKNRITLEEVRDHALALHMLDVRRADYLLDYAQPVEALLQEHPIKNMNSRTLSRVPVYFIVSKATPDAEAVLAKLTAAYERLWKKFGHDPVK